MVSGPDILALVSSYALAGGIALLVVWLLPWIALAMGVLALVVLAACATTN